MAAILLTQDVAGRIERRAGRARDLAATSPATAPLLAFYAQLCNEQQRLLARADHRDRLAGGHCLAEAIDRDAVVGAVRNLLAWLPNVAPAPLADAATAWVSRPPGDWRRRLDAFIERLPDRGGDQHEAFVLEAALQPFAEAGAARLRGEGGMTGGAMEVRCPFCGDQPSVGALREAGHGARRSYVCGLCLAEWPAARLGCTTCGEAAFDRMPVFRADGLAAARVDACDACRVYQKTIDLTRDGHAIPVVDDLATLSLDLWARERGYRRLRPHLLQV